MLTTLLLACFLLKPLPDSIPSADSTTRVRPKLKAAFNLDFRNSFLKRQPVNVWGINAGITYGVKRHQITLGYYWLSYATYLRLIDWRRDAARRINLGYYTQTDMWFVNLQYWWNMTNNRKWTVSVPVEIGGGVAYALPLDLRKETQIDRTKHDFFVPIQIGTYAQWKATRWVGISGQIGYRYSLFRSDINQNFNGTYYSIGVTVFPAFFTDVWKAVTQKARISPIHPPHYNQK
jgi:hypothetical protein